MTPHQDGLPALPEPEIDGTCYHQDLKICYTGKVHFTADQMRAYALEALAALPLPEWLNRFHHLMKKHNLHPGRTDDDLLEILDAHLSAAHPKAQPASPELIEKARKYDHVAPYLCKTCGGFGLVDRSTRDGPDAEPCPDCNAASPERKPLTEEQISKGCNYAIELSNEIERAAFRKGVKFAEDAHRIATTQEPRT